MRCRSFWPVGLLLGAWALAAASAEAAAVVLSNRTDQEVRFRMLPAEPPPVDYRLPAGESAPIPVTGALEVSFTGTSGVRRQVVEPYGVYFFERDKDGRLTLEEIGLGRNAAPPKPPLYGVVKTTQILTIPIKILVDEEEPGTRQAWEERIRKRIQAASDVLERTCHVRLKVVGADTWESDNSLTELKDLYSDFRTKTRAAPAALAVGFTSQLRRPAERLEIGCTGGPLGSHLLFSEWVPATEPERLEMLLHTLGHFLGAPHSPEPTSIMRPQFLDRRALHREHRMAFDPVNALIMFLVGEEVRQHKIRDFGQISADTRRHLHRIYRQLERAMPDDPTPQLYLDLLKPLAETKAEPGEGLPAASRRVVAAVTEAARQNSKQPRPLAGDELTEHYVRAAATAARELPAEHAVPAFLLGLAVAVDDTEALRKNPLTEELCRKAEADAEREQRLEVLGSPTMRGRRDLTLHFAIAAALTARVGPVLAESTALMKEKLDMQPGGSGFSFADLAADLAGVVFAETLRAAPDRLAAIAADFRVADHVPDVKGLREGLTQAAFDREFGSFSEERFQREQAAIRDRILALPAYRPTKPIPPEAPR
jgi:hypothetical protein